MEPVSNRVPKGPLHPWDGYLAGPENELALAAAQALARGEYDGISPLVVHGPSGVGKSRLLAGLVTEWLRRQPGSSVAYLDAEAFLVSCLEAAATGGIGWSALRGRFRSVNLFVLEDLEGLERGPLARDELLHTLDALEGIGAGMAFSTRSAPGTWSTQAWPHRLLNRLSGGLAVRILPPGLTSRRRYILQHVGQRELGLQAEVVERLAEVADGYRTLDGWISRLALEARLNEEQNTEKPAVNRPRSGLRSLGNQDASRVSLDLQMVAAILSEDALLDRPLVTIDTIARSVAGQFHIQISALRGPSRRPSVVTARHIAMHLARTWAGLSFVAIGRYFGGRDAATVRYACKAALSRLGADPALATAVATVEAPWIRPKS